MERKREKTKTLPNQGSTRQDGQFNDRMGKAVCHLPEYPNSSKSGSFTQVSLTSFENFLQSSFRLKRLDLCLITITTVQKYETVWNLKAPNWINYFVKR